jgi:hypothetical protein
MRTDVKIVFMLENPMLDVEKDPANERIYSSMIMQKILNTWITTGVLIKAEEHVLPNGLIRHRILRKKDA